MASANEKESPRSFYVDQWARDRAVQATVLRAAARLNAVAVVNGEHPPHLMELADMIEGGEVILEIPNGQV